jgi:hypothetical protein
MPPAQQNSPFNSYQNNIPQVRQLDDTLIPLRHAYYGDATLQPNTGLTNSYDYALFGLALHELLDRLRLSIIVSCLVLSVVIFFTWWLRILHPISLSLLILLGVMVLILLVVELSSILQAAGGNSASSGNSSNTDDASARGQLTKAFRFTEHVGLMVLYHPIGKTVYLVLCSTLCWAVGGAWEKLLGLLFAANAAVLMYCWSTYPEFRRTFDKPSDAASSSEDDFPQGEARSASWSYYYDKVGEHSSLIGSALQRSETT